jgi:hypothetical protein
VLQWSPVTVERIAAANLMRREIEARAELVKGEWTEAKTAAEDAETALFTALDAAEEKHKKDQGWAKDTTDAVRKLQREHHKKRDHFDLKDREKRSVEDRAKKLVKSVLALVDEAAEGKEKDLWTKEDKDTGAAWNQIQLVDIMGDLYAEAFGTVGVKSVADALEAEKAGSFAVWVKERNLTKEQLESLAAELATYMDRRGLADRIPEAWRGKVHAKILKPVAPDDASDKPGGKGKREKPSEDQGQAGAFQAVAISDKDAQLLRKYQGTRTWDETPAVHGIDGKKKLATPQGWPFVEWDVHPLDGGLTTLEIPLMGAERLLDLSQVSVYLADCEAPTPVAFMSAALEAMNPKRGKGIKAQLSLGEGHDALLAFVLDRMARTALEFAASPRYSDFLAGAWNLGFYDRIRSLSPITAALMEREREIAAAGGPAPAPAAEPGAPANLTVNGRKPKAGGKPAAPHPKPKPAKKKGAQR